MAGKSVVLIERGQAAVDKACGEGVMPPGLAHLRRIGVEIPESGSHPFKGIRYRDGEVVAEADFLEGPGLGIRRLVLSEQLRNRAIDLGVDLRAGVEALEFTETGEDVALMTTRGAVRGRYLVAADGLHSQLRKWAGIPTHVGPGRRLGIRRHFAVRPWSDHVEVWWADGVEAYVTPVGPEQVGVAFLWSGARGNYELFLERFPELAGRLRNPSSAIRGAGPFDVQVAQRRKGRVLLVGDAAGYVDAITGEGLNLGFEAAEALVHCTLAGRPEDYEGAWQAVYRRHRLLTRLLLWVANRPWLRRRVVRALAASPVGFQGFLALNSGFIPPWAALPTLGRVGLGLLRG